MKKIDYKRELGPLYKASPKKPELIAVPDMNFLMVDGKGSPESPGFSAAVEALFALAYALKFRVKKGGGEIDYGVMPLEGLWWADDYSVFITGDKKRWMWTVMIMQPDLIDQALVEEMTDEVAAKKNPEALSKVRFHSYTEGLAAQITHIGPFSEEGPTIEGLHDFIRESGHELNGKHHEIYLSDTRRAAPERWKTIIRQPVS
ncbi:MAG: GyrI-like domain-containing protein [Arenicellales bacterium]|jgi:hypothetical protein|nr:GyrI-like domain-containing protein [Arenicellales bacterium]MDP6433790.1 GyrI-like domain-containing protein [Arenicellales bacterium]MDP6672826.1 GyrI-like domain-containing protein [Arenicellales bacterium]MDP6724796.1 GyrI-like domain-containing protein [Arenicellales bacterium]MDP7155128.1 GyrI-like domain-containing protein [Arenicellales bacterium]|tara:strand:- start:541 stop:1149 length:609 start_codon:yes stop_codon:yes gene_type:complete